MQDEFKPLVEEVSLLCKNYFCDDLLAIYLNGSIAMNDAVPYVSDLDYHAIISRSLTLEERQHLKKIETHLQESYPVVDGVHISVRSVEELAKDKFTRFVLKYNSSLYFGKNIVKELENNGCEIYKPNADIAKGRLAFARECLAQALNGKQPMCTGGIPNNTFYASRKFARYFVIIEGAYFLMSRNKFEAFEKETVLKGLYRCTNSFNEELDMTHAILKDPVNAGVTHDEFLKRIHSFVEWMFDSIEKA